MTGEARTQAELAAEVARLCKRLAEAGSALAASRPRGVSSEDQRFRMALANAPVMVFAADDQLRYTWLHNPPEPFTAEQMIGKRADELLSEDEARELTAALRQVVRTGLALQREVRIVRAGQERFYDLSLEPLIAEDQRVAGVTGAAIEVTQRKLAERQAERVRQEAEAVNRSKDAFFAQLSHELRTPLAPVLMSISQMQMRRDLPPDVLEQVRMIRRNIEALARLTDDLLDLTRIGRGKLELRQQVVDVCELLHHAVEVCAADAAAKHLTVNLHVEKGQHYVLGDGDRLEQVFWNLVKNAVKFTPPEGTITVRCSGMPGKRLAIEVADTGIGIEADTLSKLFTPFEQGGPETTRRFGGLGLGLAISRRLVEMHGGRLHAASGGPGNGATFTVELPAAGRRVDKAPATLVHVEHTQPLRILLVEDHADTAHTMGRLLESFGHEVRIASGVAAALEAARNHPLDLVICDLGLPDGSGLDLMPLLARNYGLEGIAVSGYGMQEDIDRSRQAGFTEHIVKPIDVQKLEEMLRPIARRAAQREASARRPTGGQPPS